MLLTESVHLLINLLAMTWKIQSREKYFQPCQISLYCPFHLVPLSSSLTPFIFLLILKIQTFTGFLVIYSITKYIKSNLFKDLWYVWFETYPRLLSFGWKSNTEFPFLSLQWKWFLMEISESCFIISYLQLLYTNSQVLSTLPHDDTLCAIY